MPTKSVEREIVENGYLPRDRYWNMNAEAFGAIQEEPVENGRVYKLARRKADEQSVTVGEEPSGFGKGVVWDRSHAKIMVAAFISGADYLGVSVENLKKGDIVYFSSASGICSFAEDEENKYAKSIIGIVAAGTDIALGALGAPEFIPLVHAGQEFANQVFEPQKVKTKRRDAFGEDPATGHRARQEGGVLVCLPGAHSVFYSGNGDHKERWIKDPGSRFDAYLPAHVHDAFFPMKPVHGYHHWHNTRVVKRDGELYVLPWDWDHGDNFGYYKVFLLIRQAVA